MGRGQRLAAYMPGVARKLSINQLQHQAASRGGHLLGLAATPSRVAFGILLTASCCCCFEGAVGHESQSSPVSSQDAMSWKEIQQAELTPDGAWLVYRLTATTENRRMEGVDALKSASVVVARSTRDGIERRYDIGDAERTGPEIKIAASSRWIAFSVAAADSGSVPRSETSNLPRENAVVAVELSTGRRLDFPGAREFAFGGKGSEWIAVRAALASDAAPAALQILRLSDGKTEALTMATEFAFSPDGSQLAWIGSDGPYLREMASGTTRKLDSMVGASYQRLSWSTGGRALAVFREKSGQAARGSTRFSILAFTVHGTLRKIVLDPNEMAGFPSGFDICPEGISRYLPGAREALTWRGDERGLYFGIRAMQGAPPGAADLVSDLAIWHWEDPRLPGAKESQAEADRQFSYLSFVSLRDRHFVRLADPTLRTVLVQRSGPYVVGFDSRAYDLEYNIDRRRYRDYYAINLLTGRRSLIVRRLLLPDSKYGQLGLDPQLSPDGSIALYVENGQLVAFDISSGTRRDLTGELPFDFYRKTFLYADLRHDMDLYPSIQGWTADGRYVLAWDRYDVWALPLRGGTARNLTTNGRTDQIRYVRTDFGPRTYYANPFPYDDASRFVDLSRPIYLRAIKLSTRATGLARVVPGRTAPEMLRWENADIRYQKAASSDVYVCTLQTAIRFPDYYSVDADWTPGLPLTDANPQQRTFDWSPGARLVSYTTAEGDSLQGVLHLPAGYESGKEYPTVVAIYQLQSQDFNSYRAPVADGAIEVQGEIPRYTQHGYAVFEPDILPHIGDSGFAALHAVLAGVAAAVSTGVVDPNRLGLAGHSYGGFETNFIIANTNTFRAAAAGGGIVNIWSQYGNTYEGKLPDSMIDDMYMGGPWWERWDEYLRNSPLFHARDVHTPLLLMHGREDEIVPLAQSLEFFNTLRQSGGKSVVLLEYAGEGHVLRRPENLRDFSRRRLEFFDHFLKDAPAPSWWADGLSYPKAQ